MHTKKQKQKRLTKLNNKYDNKLRVGSGQLMVFQNVY